MRCGKSGDVAVAEFTERFDEVVLTPDEFEVPEEALEEAYDCIDPELRRIIERAHDNIKHFHEKNLRESWEETYDDGTVLGQRITPIESAGVYVPGGKAFYPSSVLMNIVPARVAGVRRSSWSRRLPAKAAFTPACSRPPRSPAPPASSASAAPRLSRPGLWHRHHPRGHQDYRARQHLCHRRQGPRAAPGRY